MSSSIAIFYCESLAVCHGKTDIMHRDFNGQGLVCRTVKIVGVRKLGAFWPQSDRNLITNHSVLSDNLLDNHDNLQGFYALLGAVDIYAERQMPFVFLLRKRVYNQ